MIRATPPTRRRWRVLAWRGRWWLAAAGAVVAARVLIPIAVPASGEIATAVTASTDLAAGTRLAASDLQVTELPADTLPSSHFADPIELVGQHLAVPEPAGAVLVREHLVGPGLATGAPPDRVVAPLTPAQPEIIGVLRAGDRVDVLAASGDFAGPSEASTLATSAQVVAALGSQESMVGTTSGEPLVFVLVTRDEAAALAGAAGSAPLSLVLVP